MTLTLVLLLDLSRAGSLAMYFHAQYLIAVFSKILKWVTSFLFYSDETKTQRPNDLLGQNQGHTAKCHD